MTAPLASTIHDPAWVIAIKVFAVFGILVVLTLFNIWWERRVVARMQHRIGPNMHGPFGLLQSLADGVKLALKEDLTPTRADVVVFTAAPVLAVVPAFVAFSVIPLGPVVRIPWTDTWTALQLANLPVGVLFVMALGSIGIYGIVLGGWASGSTYSLLGALRSSAQMISYEIPMGLALVAVFIYSGSLSTSDVITAQTHWWNAAVLLPSFVIYVLSMIGETNRAPFDLPEAEGEVVGGFHTEYSSLRFALFFLAEYINMATLSALAATLFLGGWHGPIESGAWPVLWFFLKVFAFIWFFIWLRGTLPRLRYDQFMGFGWKLLLPASIVWIGVVSIARMAALKNGVDERPWLALGGAVVTLAVVWVLLSKKEKAAIDSPLQQAFPTPEMPAGGAVRGAAKPLTFPSAGPALKGADQ